MIITVDIGRPIRILGSMIRFIEQRFDLDELPFHVNGIGIHETMAPGIIDRPGTGDWLIILFHGSIVMQHKGRERAYGKNTFVIWGPRVWQFYGNPKKHWPHSWIHVQGTMVENQLLGESLHSNQPISLDAEEPFTKILSDLYTEVRLEAHPDYTIQQNLFQNLLRTVVRSSHLDTVRIPGKLLKVKRHIDTHTDTAHSLAELAHMANMSASHFSAEFKRFIGTPPVEYSIRQRLQQARYLLSDPSIPIAEIAERTGYFDIYQFSKQFKKHMGTSPRNYQGNTKS